MPAHADEYFYYWHGWDLQYKWIRHLYSNRTLAQRHPDAIWRGRVADDDYPERDALRSESLLADETQLPLLLLVLAICSITWCQAWQYGTLI